MCTCFICISLDSRFCCFCRWQDFLLRPGKWLTQHTWESLLVPQQEAVILNLKTFLSHLKWKNLWRSCIGCVFCQMTQDHLLLGFFEHQYRWKFIFQRCSSHHTIGCVRIHMGLGPRKHGRDKPRPQLFHVELWSTQEGITWRCPRGCCTLKCS